MAKVETLLKDIENRELVLPEFQRDYVWKEEDVKKFIQSIYKNYPTGSLLIWKTLTPPKLRGAYKTSEVGYTKVILDGQQRLTTLFFLLKNKSPPYYESREFNFNLWFNVEADEFRYYQKTIMDGKREWISVRKFFEFREVAEFINSFTDKEIREYYFKWMNPLTKLSRIKDYEYFVDEEKLTKIEEIKEIVKIFNLVNKQGRTLIEEDLALARISVFWPEIKDLLREESTLLKQKNFELDFNFFVLCINCVATGHAKFDNLLNENISEDKIKDAWDRVRRSIEYLSNILHDKAYINSDQPYELKSKALLVPIITYLSNNKIEFKNEDDLKKFLYWFYSAMMWGRYTRRGKSSPLEQDIVAITKENNPDALIYNLKREVRNFEVTAKELEGAGVTSPFFNMAFILAKYNGAVDWFNGNKLHSNLIGSSYKLHKHHIFPKEFLRKKGYIKDRDKKKLVNEIANRAFLTERANKQILASKPALYLKKVIEKYPKALEQQLVSTKEVLWEEENFEEFLKDRRERLSKSINKFMESLIKKELPEISIKDLISSEESFNLEFKSSFAYDIKEDKLNKDLRNSVSKEILAFMNSGGGTLLIGVSDEHRILGLEKDFSITHKENKDGFIQEFVQFIESAIGGVNTFKRCIEIKFHNIDNKEILEVRIDKSPKPQFFKVNGSKILYIRDENRVIPLQDPEEINDYIKENFD